MAVTAGVLTWAPGTSAGQAAFLGSAGAAPIRLASSTLTLYSPFQRALRAYRTQGGILEMRREAQQAAERRADARRAARLAAERRAAARQAAAQEASEGAGSSTSTGSSPNAGGSSPQPSGSPQQIALSMLGAFGWPSSQFGCLQSLWNVESGWNPYASNPSTGAYGIPQALPGSKMASAGPDWQANPATQIRWGLGYIKGLYGSPCGAWSHEQAVGWY